MMSRHDSIVISSPVLFETSNALELRIFRGQASSEEVAGALQALESDVELGTLRLLAFPLAAWDLARRLSRMHSARLGTRSFDILQVATALTLKANAFLTFDRTQATLARAEGLETPVPEG